jgi:xylan 1,4-beta-xylosidase
MIPMKKLIIVVSILVSVYFTLTGSTEITYCNPINISYRFCLDAPSRREAADPTIVLYKNKYFLFASKSGGYWYSDDLHLWNFVAITTAALPIEDYAPTAVVIKDSLYLMTAATNKIYRSGDPVGGTWEVYCTLPSAYNDPALFADSDGKVYLYYGCSNTDLLHAVELDVNNKLKPTGKTVNTWKADTKVHGWERNGDYNASATAPWIEGSWMNKHDGKYYLQYAGPGTENKSYADGVYVSFNPLGPFTYAANNPFSSKPEGFVCGAGHGSTFEDKFGNWWHIATMTISVKHMFERRLGLFPVGFDNDSNLFVCSSFGDYPIIIPDHKVDNIFELSCGWRLLSYKKTAEASSSIVTLPTTLAFDENIRTYWSAQTGNSGEWLSVDLDSVSTINAVQVNFAENNSLLYGRTSVNAQQYLIEYSIDNISWDTLVDKTTNNEDLTHQYSVMDSAVKARYLKVTNYRVPGGTFAISDFRVFGSNLKIKPEKTSSINISRTDLDSKNVTLSWKKDSNATGYNIRFGFQDDKLYRSYIVYGDTSVTIRSLNADQAYWFVIDAFGEGGLTAGDTTEAVITHDTTVQVIHEKLTGNNFMIYPNPLNSYVIIRKSDSNIPAKLDIYNVLGMKIQSELLLKKETILSAGKLKEGIYLFVITYDNAIETKQILVQR